MSAGANTAFEHQLVINGQGRSIVIEPTTTLLEVLRDELRLTGAKEACGRGECGACTVLAGGATINSCVALAARTTSPVVTVEGLASRFPDLRRAFAENGAFQCGFCTPGMVVRAAWLVEFFDGPWTRDELRRQLAGNVCRCTGYQGIIDAIVETRRRRDAAPQTGSGSGGSGG